MQVLGDAAAHRLDSASGTFRRSHRFMPLEFLAPDHPVHALHLAEPLEIVWNFYSPRSSFAYPGGESTLDWTAGQTHG
ncbi:hypothetical protein GA0070618_4655 [Micromonospora echinospora]|uniref:Uncharacterized protein n=1 Tax=Micromonospora echinospora TaxID=1877 RepID=A0A1C4Z179_MICEC|nr:hypothetical protein GA0070618_4655 [Micromonospora echinospora]